MSAFDKESRRGFAMLQSSSTDGNTRSRNEVQPLPVLRTAAMQVVNCWTYRHD